MFYFISFFEKIQLDILFEMSHNIPEKLDLKPKISRLLASW